MGKKIIKYVAKSFLIDDIIENPDELFQVFKEIDELSHHLKSSGCHPPFSPVHATFGGHINIVNSGKRTIVCVMAVLHEDDTELPVSIVICTPLEELLFIHSPTCELFAKEYITQVCRLFIDAGHGLIETFRLIQQTFDMNRADALMNYNNTINKYFPEKYISSESVIHWHAPLIGACLKIMFEHDFDIVRLDPMFGIYLLDLDNINFDTYLSIKRKAQRNIGVDYLYNIKVSHRLNPWIGSFDYHHLNDDEAHLKRMMETLWIPNDMIPDFNQTPVKNSWLERKMKRGK